MLNRLPRPTQWALLACGSSRREPAVSCQAIATALARTDLSWASVWSRSRRPAADRQKRARPGNVAAAAQAGLGKSRDYLQPREQLVQRGLMVVEDAAEVAAGLARSIRLCILHTLTGSVDTREQERIWCM